MPPAVPPKVVPLTLDARLLEILACPVDKGPLLYFEDESALYNPGSVGATGSSPATSR
ncbi:MAG: Trm112 family protein [Acidimicrobiales bacterium]